MGSLLTFGKEIKEWKRRLRDRWRWWHSSTHSTELAPSFNCISLASRNIDTGFIFRFHNLLIFSNTYEIIRLYPLDSSKAKPSNIVYCPNNIGQAVPAGSKTYGILIEGKDEKGEVSALIMNTLLKRGARILSQTGYLNEKYKEFTLVLTCDLNYANGTLDDIIIQLRRIKHVTRADSHNLKNQMFHGLLFPLVLMDTNRVVAVNSGLTFEIQEGLRTEFEKSILAEAGRSYGKSIIRTIKQRFEQAEKTKTLPLDVETLEQNVTGYLKASGWGKFRWELQENYEQVVIYDPPTSQKGGSAAGNMFLQGMVAGITDEFRNKSFSIMEDHYDPQSRLLTLTLIESNANSLLLQTREEKLLPEQKTKVLEEIEKVIKSVEVVGAQTKEPDEIKSEQIREQQVIEIPVTDSGNRIHITLKTRGRGSESKINKKTADEQSTSSILNADNGSTLSEARLLKQNEQKEEASAMQVDKIVQSSEIVIESNENKATNEAGKEQTTSILPTESPVPSSVAQKQEQLMEDEGRSKTSGDSRTFEPVIEAVDDQTEAKDSIPPPVKKRAPREVETADDLVDEFASEYDELDLN